MPAIRSIELLESISDTLDDEVLLVVCDVALKFVITDTGLLVADVPSCKMYCRL